MNLFDQIETTLQSYDIDRLLNLLDGLPHKDTRVLVYILRNTNRETMIFDCSYNDLVKHTGIAKGTVNKMMQYLQTNGYMKFISNSKYLLSIGK